MDAEKQNKLRDFVDREVYCCVSMLIYELGQNEKYMDEILEFSSQYETLYTAEFTCDKCDNSWETEGLETDDETENAEDCPECGEKDVKPWNHEEYQSDDPTEALEHWIVSKWLAYRLEEKGEMITHDFYGLAIWGRRCSGQAILLDGVIKQIYDEVMKP